MTPRSLSVLLALALIVSLGFIAFGSLDSTVAETKDSALERTRKQVRMLDDLYKTAVVLITDKYVHTKDDFAAGSAAVALFKAMKDKGWHEVRLLDATGEPISRKNSPKDAFEKEAVKKLLAGESTHEKVETRDGKRVLRSATVVPVVHERCVLCHDNYKDVPKGKPIGVLGYTLTIE